MLLDSQSAAHTGMSAVSTMASANRRRIRPRIAPRAYNPCGRDANATLWRRLARGHTGRWSTRPAPAAPPEPHRRSSEVVPGAARAGALAARASASLHRVTNLGRAGLVTLLEPCHPLLGRAVGPALRAHMPLG